MISVEKQLSCGGTSISVSCPVCKGTKLARYGKTAAGRQKYRCLDEKGIGCRRQFVAGSDHLIDPDVKARVETMLAENVAPKIIAKVLPGITLRWIYELRRRRRNR